MSQELISRYESLEQEYQNDLNKYPIDKRELLNEMLEFLIENLPKIPEGPEGIWFVDTYSDLAFTYRLLREGELIKEVKSTTFKEFVFDKLYFKKPEVRTNILRETPEIIIKFLKAYNEKVEGKKS